jgi:hypothetical protein
MKRRAGRAPLKGYGRPQISEAVWEQFLAEICSNPNVAAACRATGVTYGGLREKKMRDKEFKARFDAAYSQGWDDLEGKATDRAFNGVARGVYYKGDRVDEEIHYSDALTMFLLKGNIDKYRDRMEISGKLDITNALQAARLRTKRGEASE